MLALLNKIVSGFVLFVFFINSIAQSTPLGLTHPNQDDKNRKLRDSIDKGGVTTPLIEYPVSAQYPTQFFEDGKVPKMLSDLQSQQYLLRQHRESILKRTEADSKKPLVTIAVFDIGVDLGNENIRNHVKFDVKDGKIVGAGYDFMSLTPWGTHKIVDPWIFAIGAEDVNDYGQIRNALDKSESLQSKKSKLGPIETLMQMNDALVEQALAEIKKTPDLKGTFFEKLNSKNINIFGLMQLAQLPISEQEYADNLSKNDTYKLNSEVKDSTPSSIKTFISKPDLSWVVNPATGLSDGLEVIGKDLSKIEGILKVQEILNSTFQKEGQLDLFNKTLENVSKFFTFHHFPPGAQFEDIIAYSSAKLSNLISLNKLGSQIESPLFDFFSLVRKMYYQNPNLDWNKLISTSFVFYEGLLKTYHSANSYYKEAALVAETQGYLNDLNYLKKFIEEQTKENQLEKKFNDYISYGRFPWIEGVSSQQRKMLVRATNPLFHPDSESADHGVHVAGTPTSYFDDYRIFPIRVSLGMVKGNALIQKQYVGKNIQALHEWLQIPVVARSVLNTLKKDAKVSSDLLNYDITNPARRKAFADFMMANYFNSYLKNTASQSGIVSQSLHWEIQEGAKIVADLKIPFANASLGGEIEQPDYDKYQNQDSEKIKASLDFFFAEFQKYVIAEAVNGVGKNTLFMMAAGNSKNYADNESRTNYPAGLSSPWLLKNLKSGETIASQGIKNVAIVMSLNEKNALSNYNNLILSGEDVIAIRGEDIQSQSTSFSMLGARKTFRRMLPEVRMYDFNPEDSRFVAFLQNNKVPNSLVSKYIKVAKSFALVSRLFLFLKYNDHRDLKNGTSMAAPTLIALASEMFQKKLVRLGKKQGKLITEDMVYGQEGFRPEDIMKLIKKNAVSENFGPNVKIHKIKNAKNQKPSEKETEFTELLLKIRNSGALCLRHYSKN